MRGRWMRQKESLPHPVFGRVKQGLVLGRIGGVLQGRILYGRRHGLFRERRACGLKGHRLPTGEVKDVF